VVRQRSAHPAHLLRPGILDSGDAGRGGSCCRRRDRVLRTPLGSAGGQTLRSREEERVLPTARRERLLVYEFADEVLVYDLDRQRGHSLGPEAAAVWGWCDGRTRVSDALARLRDRGRSEVNRDLLQAVLRRLQRARLIAGGVERPSGDRVTRRACLRKLAATGGFLVASVAIPSPSEAASCLTRRQCRRGESVPCSGLPCCGGGRCQRRANHCQCR